MGIKQDYIEKSFNILKNYFPKEKANRVKELIESKIKEKFKDPSINIDNNVTKENRNITLSTLTNWISVEKPIISGNATFYMKPEELKSPTSNMLLSLKTGRKELKASMFEFDPMSYEYIRRDLGQQNIKIIMNADYGASGTLTAAFYTVYSPAATTLKAQSMVTTAAAFFEGFIGNNQKFFSINEFFDWTNQVLKKEIETDDWIKVPTTEEVKARVYSLFYQFDFTSTKLLDKFTEGLSNYEKILIYYTNNLNEFIRRHTKLQKIIKSILTKLPNLEAASTVEEIPIEFRNQFNKTKDYNDFMSKKMFLNPYKPPEIIKTEIKELSEILIKYCYVDYLTPDSIVKLNNRRRNTVLLVDTDSNVINANLFVEFVLDELFKNENFGRKRMYNDMICINTIASVISVAIDKLLKFYCKCHNNSPSNVNEIVMKNEFMFKTFFMMNMKKRYTASIVLREGHIMVPFKLEIKGMDFIKAVVSDTVTARFTKILKDNILFSETPNLHGLMRDSKQFEREILKSINQGETEFYKTSVFKDAKGYKDADNAWRLQVYRGAMIWNELYPLNKIYSLDRVKIIKLKVKDQKDLTEINQIDNQIYHKITTQIFNSPNENLVKAGLSVIAIPQSLKKLPDWLIPLVDKEITISNIMSSFGSVFRVLGVESPRVITPNDKAVLYSPIISI